MDDTKISKTLSYYLRHGATQEGIPIDEHGYVDVHLLLEKKDFTHLKFEDIERVVKHNSKQRFEMMDGMIRARQGHSIQIIKDPGFTPITSIEDIDRLAIHGTYMELLHTLLASPGISRMARQHIHMTTPDIVFNGKKGTQSGVRYDTDLFIWVNLQKVLALGLPLMRSSNGVILCPGDADGFIPWSCIEKCTNRQQKDILIKENKM